MSDVDKLLDRLSSETYIERLIGDVDVERLDGTILKNVSLLRKEKLADSDDIESVYEREYVAEHDDEEIFLGNDKGETITIKERRLENERTF